MRLLRAATEAAGGVADLARRLGISVTALQAYAADPTKMPDPLLLRTIDVILEDREARLGGDR